MHGKDTTVPCLLTARQAVVNHTPWLGIKQIKVCVCVCVCLSVSVCVCVHVHVVCNVFTHVGLGWGREGGKGSDNCYCCHCLGM